MDRSHCEVSSSAQESAAGGPRAFVSRVVLTPSEQSEAIEIGVPCQCATGMS